MEEMSPPDEEEWESYREDTREPGGGNGRPSAMFRGQGRVYGAWTQGLWHTGLSAGGTEDSARKAPSLVSPDPKTKPSNKTKQCGCGQPMGIKAYFWTTKKEGKVVRSVILKMRRNNSLSYLVSVSSRGRGSLDRKELEPRARKHMSEKPRPEPAAMHVTPWKQTHARTGLWPGPVGGPGKQETGEERRAAVSVSVWVCVRKPWMPQTTYLWLGHRFPLRTVYSGETQTQIHVCELGTQKLVAGCVGQRPMCFIRLTSTVMGKTKMILISLVTKRTTPSPIQIPSAFPLENLTVNSFCLS